MKKLLKKLINKETISYIIFGGLTTVVNYAVYYLFYKFTDVNYVVYNVIAWIAAVLFAFITNKLFVFESKSFNAKTILRELLSFVAARLLSLLFETAFLAVTVNFFHLNELIAKIAACIFVVIINYFFSKFFIFRKNKEESDD
ncbi:MAG: GtrA family protein [Butyrivibrio sp.]